MRWDTKAICPHPLVKVVVPARGELGKSTPVLPQPDVEVNEELNVPVDKSPKEIVAHFPRAPLEEFSLSQGERQRGSPGSWHGA